MAKKIGDKVYVHVSALDTLSAAQQEIVKEAWTKLPNEQEMFFNIVKVDEKHRCVTFLWSPRFDDEDEPVLVYSCKVDSEGKATIRYESEVNPSIYHGKHFFVKEDYTGFDVAAAKKRYEAWKNSGIPEICGSKIGKFKYWHEIVLPKLTMFMKKEIDKRGVGLIE